MITKRIVKYKKHKNYEGNLITPYWIEDGGFFAYDNIYVGIIDDESEYYTPKTNKQDSSSDLEELDNDELKDYIENLPLKFIDEEEKIVDNRKVAENWLTRKELQATAMEYANRKV